MQEQRRPIAYPTYKYLPLEDASQTRVVQVHTSESFYDPIHVSLSIIPVPAEDDPNSYEYQTLSYVWGRNFLDGSHLTQVVFCDGRQIRITSTLHNFLRRFRMKLAADANISIPIWIDALSVNQRDQRERASQMSLMPNIYKHSSRLVIWLGEVGSDGRKSAIRTFRAFPGLKDRFGRYVDPLDDPKFEDRRAPLVQDLLTNKWFQRRWVVQEVMHSAGIERSFWFRASEITWEEFFTELDSEHVKETDRPAIMKKGVSTSLSQNKKNSLLRNLWLWEDAACADPRDKVHALISISRDADSLVMNYSSSAETVYLQVAQQIAQSGNGHFVCALLVCAIIHARGIPRSTTPSWVPDWRNKLIADTNENRDFTDGERQAFNICFDGEGPYQDSPFILTAKVEHRLLHLEGWLIPVCHAAARGYPCDGRCREKNNEYGYHDCAFTLAKSHVYKNSQNRLDVRDWQILCLLKDSPIAFALFKIEKDFLNNEVDRRTNFRLETCFAMRSGWEHTFLALGEPTRFVIH